MSRGPFRTVIFVALCIAALTGCAASSTSVGWPPKYSALESLSRGRSGEEDIRRALGTPTGHGEMRTGRVTEPTTVWSYEHAVASAGGQLELGILLVFLRDGRYDGHLWFSAGSLLEAER
jgi:hypothetical protein